MTEQIPHDAPEPADERWVPRLHLSLITGTVIPVVGFIVPALIWRRKRTTVADLDAHGRNVVNWILSLLLYGLVGGILAAIVAPIFARLAFPMLSLYMIGIPVWGALAIANVIVALKGRQHALRGETWSVPYALPLLFGEGENDDEHWAMLLHLSILAGYVLPLTGFIVPVLIWQRKRDESPMLDEQGQNVVNWILTFLLYALACAVLCLIYVGIPLLLALLLANVVLPFIGALKAKRGEIWRYPYTLELYKEEAPEQGGNER